jgi:hypothetical protein
MTKKFLWLNAYQWTCVLYVAVAIFSWQLKYFRHIDNNYLIFRQSWYHLKDQLNLYAAYPKEYYDFYYYGPVFGVFAMPFALPSEVAGLFLWEVANALAVIIAVNMLPLSQKRKMILLLLCAIEFSNSSFYMQFNPIIAAFMIISFMMVEKGKEQWATLLIVLGTLIKLYPVVGLVYILFSKNRSKFVIWTLVWSVVFFVLPMLFASSSYIINSYHQWMAAVSYKNQLNTGLNTSQDMCVMGVVRRLLQNSNVPNLPFLIGAAIIFSLPFLRFSQFKSYTFRLQILATALIMVVIFSTGAEHPTFIIAVAGCFLWMMIQQKPFTATHIVLIVLLLFITGLGLTDAMPKLIRQDYIAKYSIKAWPCIIVWFIISYELLFKDFTTPSVSKTEKEVIILS